MTLQQLYSFCRKGIDDYNLIEENDKIAVGLSGGKDSLTLLYALKGLQRFYPKKFELIAIHVNLGFPDFSGDVMQDFCQKLGIEYHQLDTEIQKIVFELHPEEKPCSLCARLRKGALNEEAVKLGCNKIAYAHHKDDFLETMMMSLMYEGRFYSFSPKTQLTRSGLTVIRPMIYVNESDVIGFSHKYQLPVTKNPCPADGFTKREYAKQLIKQLKSQNPQVKERFFHAIQNAEFDDWPKKKPVGTEKRSS